MFRLLSKESNIFSIPVYMAFLLLITLLFNILNFSALELISESVTFIGIALGYFLFNKINLNQQIHLPLFLYTFFVFALYPGNLDIGLSVALLSNSFLLLILTNTEDRVRKNAFVLVGVLLAINYFFLPTTWPLLLFVIIHIIATSAQISLNLFRLFLGFFLISISYLSIMFSMDFISINMDYFPFDYSFSLRESYYPFTLLSPILLMLILAIASHFIHINEKSLVNKYKYSFVLTFSVAQSVSIVLYMNQQYEYLLLLALPASIILGRYLRYFPQYWMRELGVWCVILTLIIFKIGTFFNLKQLIFNF
ncbi:MAG: hypothetical protein JSS94_04885 [Bacteroidetes bacterium]|nr:hypothetical protein [Bacteroidota bacterium]